MIHFLYTMIIFPLEILIELSYVFIYRIFDNPALSVLGVSFTVSIITLPLYFIAEKHQRNERDIQMIMKPEADIIRAVFSGDERFMRLATYYRQNGYHPLYALRSSISLIIQIPFFIAAFHFLSNLEIIKGVSFGPILDLAKPDSLLTFDNFSINLLPIVMTLINCASAVIYTKGFPARDKFQLYGMAALFLVLLYSSPSGMVLYWTGNNVFSLIKNIIQKAKYPKRIIISLISVICLFLVVYVLFFHSGWMVKRIFLSLFLVFIPLGIFMLPYFKNKKVNFPVAGIFLNYTQYTGIFILSLVILFLLGGLVIPSSLIETSVQQFSFIDNHTSPFPFIANTILQSLGIFILWPLCVYFMLPQNIKKIVSALMAVLASIVIINVFIFPGNYGYLTLMFRFSESLDSGRLSIALNLLTMFFLFVLIITLVLRFGKIMQSALTVSVCALVLLGAINCIRVYNLFHSFQLQLQHGTRSDISDEQVFRFSRAGKNIVVITLDRAINGYIPYIFREKPHLYQAFDGFTWYRNTLSFGEFTNFGMPGIFGGYEYAPLEMQRRSNIPLVDKHNESLLLLPKIFLENDFLVTITDPPYANYSWVPDLSIFNDFPQIRADNIIGKHTDRWLFSTNSPISVYEADIIENNLIRFSFFRFLPLIFRNFVYDNGKWLNIDGVTGRMDRLILDNFVALDVLPDITEVNDNLFNSYNVLHNDLPHNPWFLQLPDYIPSNIASYRGDGPFANEEHYHVNVASLLLLGKWFDFLRENSVYDNTRIIIVSDHGRDLHSNFADNIILPNGSSLQAYAVLLMVKDFDANGSLMVDDSFMTNADVPLLALNNIVENPVNPWTGKLLESEKDDGVTITTSSLWNVSDHPRYVFNIKPDEWLHVHTNIFDPGNWSTVRQ